MAGQEESGTLSGLILEAIRAKRVETHTALPGVVEAFHVERQTVDLIIPLQRHTRDSDGVEDVIEWPKLTEVPVWMPHAGGFHISLPIAVGDECLVIFTERDVSRWLADGDSKLPPETRRLHDISDGVALMGFNSQTNKIPTFNGDDLEIGNDAGDQTVRMKADGTIEMRAPVKVVIDTPLLECTGQIKAELEITALNATTKIPLGTHKTPGIDKLGALTTTLPPVP